MPQASVCSEVLYSVPAVRSNTPDSGRNNELDPKVEEPSVPILAEPRPVTPSLTPSNNAESSLLHSRVSTSSPRPLMAPRGVMGTPSKLLYMYHNGSEYHHEQSNEPGFPPFVGPDSMGAGGTLSSQAQSSVSGRHSLLVSPQYNSDIRVESPDFLYNQRISRSHGSVQSNNDIYMSNAVSSSPGFFGYSNYQQNASQNVPQVLYFVDNNNNPQGAAAQPHNFPHHMEQRQLLSPPPSNMSLGNNIVRSNTVSPQPPLSYLLHDLNSLVVPKQRMSSGVPSVDTLGVPYMDLRPPSPNMFNQHNAAVMLPLQPSQGPANSVDPMLSLAPAAAQGLCTLLANARARLGQDDSRFASAIDHSQPMSFNKADVERFLASKNKPSVNSMERKTAPQRKSTGKNASGDDSEKMFRCTWEGCEKGYKRREHLNRHMRSHTGERPYVCRVSDCRKAFTRSDNLINHYRVHQLRNEIDPELTVKQLSQLVAVMPSYRHKMNPHHPYAGGMFAAAAMQQFAPLSVSNRLMSTPQQFNGLQVYSNEYMATPQSAGPARYHYYFDNSAKVQPNASMPMDYSGGSQPALNVSTSVSGSASLSAEHLQGSEMASGSSFSNGKLGKSDTEKAVESSINGPAVSSTDSSLSKAAKISHHFPTPVPSPLLTNATISKHEPLSNSSKETTSSSN